MERINKYFRKLVWDPQSVEDCQQQTLLRIEKALQENRYDPKRSFNRWMWTIAHRVYVDHCRERHRFPAALVVEPKTPRSGQAGIEARIDAKAVLDTLRSELSPEAFEVFILHYDQGHTISKISAVTERDRKTVRKWLQQGVRIAQRLQSPDPPS